MEDWQKNFLGILEAVTAEVEQFCLEVGEAVEVFAEDFGEALASLTLEIDNIIVAEIDQSLQDFFEPMVEIYLELEELALEEDDIGERVFYFDGDPIEETDLWLNPKIEPTATEHPACIGCGNYHGRVYGGNLLVCGMHPYGWDDENCPDWEGFNNRLN
ncbi:MAG: hypothetical protein DSM107014_14455 [Gomphosphaeria aponina SAG 52.96 = DSM 107014]|uniref:Uncharacterized protein n=1 Tax=Gomphosphaeria aponina SAG 52.96 = DSM 107014 TaxID=1521640 RepID=A0A941JTP3_9CHRO|nr:hypothetical protein [Gomphosphaeria aponina SAG 52.96 = DSM 107014]